MKDDTGALGDILEAIDALVERRSSREELEADPVGQIAVLHHLRIIGEAMTRVSEELRRAHPEVPWRSVIGMRNVIVHGYDQVDLDPVWSALENDLAPLRRQVTEILEELHD
ncbi:MAG: HepT-like ribonuclease domain-containing protein [Acidimicrobiales bacterium]